MNYSDNTGLELSKKVHGLLDHIRNLQYRNEKSDSFNRSEESENDSFIVDKSKEVMSDSDLILVEDLDFSDDEKWLYSPENMKGKSFNMKEWLKGDKRNDCGEQCSFEFDPNKSDSKKFIDTRTFTRQKKRISRPSLDSMEFYLSNKSRLSCGDHSNYLERTFESVPYVSATGCLDSSSKILEEKSNIEDISVQNIVHSNDTIERDNHSSSAPLHFKLSEPVLNSNFDRILSMGKECFDSFQNMSPPSLMNSLCSSTFTSLMDSSYMNNLEMPSDFGESFHLPSEISQEIENLNHITQSYQDIDAQKPNVTESADQTFDMNKSNQKRCDNSVAEDKKQCTENLDVNSTFDMQKTNGTFNKHDLLNSPNSFSNATFNRSSRNVKDTTQNMTAPEVMGVTYEKASEPINNSNIKNESNTNTFVKKSKADDTYTNLKSSCPDINQTFKKRAEENLSRTFQKLSDSQPNLSSEVQQTILNQTMELMSTAERFHNSKCGSADSLDERSSSISNSSKGSESRIMNMSDLDNLARLQEQSLQRVMSTPKQIKNRSLLWNGDAPSPIKNILDEDYLSDSDSDVCVTGRRDFPDCNTTKTIQTGEKPNATKELKQPSQPSQPSQRTVPTMIVKPMEVKQKPTPNDRVQSAQPLIRPRFRGSGLPRPTSANTGIPRPTSRIPGPKSIRPQLVRPTQRQLPKSDWMDGCY